jgi:hypothetical protein
VGEPWLYRLGTKLLQLDTSPQSWLDRLGRAEAKTVVSVCVLPSRSSPD